MVAAGRAVLRPGSAVIARRQLAEVSRFLTVGAGNAVVGLLAIYALKAGFHRDDVVANLGGYAVGLVFSFVMNRHWTFRHRGPILPALGRFLLVFACAYPLNLATVLALTKAAGINGYLAQACGIAPYTVTSYFGSRMLAFKRAGPTP